MLKSKRTVDILRDKASRKLTLSEELKLLNAYNDKRVIVTVEDSKIIIEKIAM